MKEGSSSGTNPELLDLLQSHANEITLLMSSHWESVINGQEQWPSLRNKRIQAQAEKLRTLFVLYIDKTLSWLDYFIRDPKWLNLSAVNYSANAAREAANEVRDSRKRFELSLEISREDLVPGRPESRVEGDDNAAA